jgi:hypothetical protein
MPVQAIPLALTLLQTGLGAYGLTQAGKVPKELQKLYDLLSERAERGIPDVLESRMRSAGYGRIARQATTAQARGSAALASRGMGRSSMADTMIGDVNRLQAELLTQFETELAGLDEQTKQQALGQLGDVSSAISMLKQQRGEAASGLIMKGLLGLLEPEIGLVKPQPSEWEKFIEYLEKHRYETPTGISPSANPFLLGLLENWG